MFSRQITSHNILRVLAAGFSLVILLLVVTGGHRHRKSQIDRGECGLAGERAERHHQPGGRDPA